MSPIPQSLLDQFPPLPQHEGTWQAIYMEPVMGSGERITVAVAAFDSEGCGVLKTLDHDRLMALFGEHADAVNTMITWVADAALRDGQSGSLEHFNAPLSGFHLGVIRSALGDDRADILQQAASLTSCFHAQPGRGLQTPRVESLQRQLAEVRGLVARDRGRLVGNPESASIRLSLQSWSHLEEELSSELSELLVDQVAESAVSTEPN